MKYIQIFLFLFLIACTAKNNQSQEVIEQIKTQGEKVCREIVESGQFDTCLDQIENGDAFLIQHADLLYQCADGANATGLKFSMCRAMLTNPKAVLTMVPEFMSIDEVCDIPYIEPEQEVINNHINGAIEALEGLEDKDAEVKECIKQYTALKARFVK